MKLIYNHKWRKIWKLNDRFELLKVNPQVYGKTWIIEKTDENDFIENRWSFSTKRDAIKFYQEGLNQ